MDTKNITRQLRHEIELNNSAISGVLQLLLDDFSAIKNDELRELVRSSNERTKVISESIDKLVGLNLKNQETERMKPDEIIKQFNLEPLPDEGGFFRRSYVCEEKVNTDRGERNFGDAIFYLITPDQFSKLHKLKCDELWHFYAGDPVTMVQVTGNSVKTIELGNTNFEKHSPQILVPKNVWQGTKLANGGSWALLGTSAFPAYDQKDFTMDSKALLTADLSESELSLIRQYL